MSVQEETTQDVQQPVETQVETRQPIQTETVNLDGEGAAHSQEAEDAQQGEQDRDEKGRFKGVQPRIDELTRKRHEAEREAAYWRGVATQGKAQPSTVEQQPTAPQKPTPEQFDDYADYMEALAEFKAEEKVAKVLSEREAKAAQQQQAQARFSTWNDRLTAARAAMTDYDQVVGASESPIATHVSDAILDSEHGPALAYHLAKHPDLLNQLNSLSPRQADREIGRLEERLAGGVSAQHASEPVKTSNAPKPASVSSAQGRSTTPNLATASMDEYVRQRKAQGARWAR